MSAEVAQRVFDILTAWVQERQLAVRVERVPTGVVVWLDDVYTYDHALMRHASVSEKLRELRPAQCRVSITNALDLLVEPVISRSTIAAGNRITIAIAPEDWTALIAPFLGGEKG